MVTGFFIPGMIRVMKKTAKAAIVSILGWQVRRLRKKHNFKIVAVVGSIGKTSTKFAIAQTLSESKRVRFQEGNYNDIISVPLIFFGHDLPSLVNPFAWLKIFISNQRQIAGAYPYDVVVAELGTDGPGQIKLFKKYLHADVAVVTALTPEHMEFFTSLKAVAEEELSVTQYSDQVLVNIDLCPEVYTSNLKDGFTAYSIKKDAKYQLTSVTYSAEGCDIRVAKDHELLVRTTHASFAEPQLYSLTAAIAVSDMLDVAPDIITKGLAKVKPVNGRMQHLRGIKNSTIIDDTYNASPEAAHAALKALYRMPALQKIALLGNMNELGTFSAQAHADLGAYCEPDHLSLVVTLGTDANKYLAEAAERNGCIVQRTNSPYEAGAYIAEHLQNNALILAKGSQNGVFAEEALKALLADKKDESKLVRQSAKWMKIKDEQFAPKKPAKNKNKDKTLDARPQVSETPEKKSKKDKKIKKLKPAKTPKNIDTKDLLKPAEPIIKSKTVEPPKIADKPKKPRKLKLPRFGKRAKTSQKVS